MYDRIDSQTICKLGIDINCSRVGVLQNTWALHHQMDQQDTKPAPLTAGLALRRVGGGLT
ncbi:hypothetical protein HanIR_Chr07g0316861 [Helianthus annuus]|nr:hypothetical protein HanIR_Chr07g0316861 [Helianthus annuus]